MRILQHPLLRWFLYLLYTLVLIIVLLIVRFPEEKFKNVIVNSIENRFPTSQCSLESMEYHFPFSINIVDLQVKSAVESQLIVKIENIFIQPQLPNPARLFNISLEGYNSVLGCRVRVDVDKDKIFIQDLLIDQLDLSELSYIHNKLGRKLSGLLTITGDFTTTMKDDNRVVGKGKASVTNGELELLRPILFQKSIDMKRVETSYNFNKETIEFSDGKFDGNQFKGDFSGTVRLLAPWPRTSLNLKGKLVAKAGALKNNPGASRMMSRLKKQYRRPTPPFVLKGELGKPVFRFGL